MADLHHRVRFVPPINFGCVEHGIYRSGFPAALNFPFLETLNLRTIVYLANQPPSATLQQFVDEHNITLIALQESNGTWNSISEETVVVAMRWILNPEAYPLLVMCGSGKHRTGTLVGCLRKLMRWNLTSVFEEYRRFAGSDVFVVNEQFIELFDLDCIDLPQNSTQFL
ncbi:hypothetical protein PCE1_001390 [Barthelona sp. PCE]